MLFELATPCREIANKRADIPSEQPDANKSATPYSKIANKQTDTPVNNPSKPATPRRVGSIGPDIERH